MKFCEITSFSSRPFDFLADEKVERKKMQPTKTFFMHNYIVQMGKIHDANFKGGDLNM